MEKEQNNMSRRRFLQVGGSIMLGAAFAGVMGRSLWKMLTNPADIFYDGKEAKRMKDELERVQFVSPYRRTFGFVVPDEITAIELIGDQIVVGTSNNIYRYGINGELQGNFSVRSGLRDVAVYNDKLYLLFPLRIEVYDRQGEAIQEWEACSDDADYCQLTVLKDGIFVTDAAAKNICQYKLDGTLARFIKSPNGFVVPSYSFGITNINGHVFCSNPGRHVVEQYTVNGEYVASFGKSGMGAGEFSGCCNPVQIIATEKGELLTSEKGLPRISCYGSDGTFHSILLDDKALGGGHSAYDMCILGDKLIVAGGNKISVFQYDARHSAQTLCGSCTIECPMKVVS